MNRQHRKQHHPRFKSHILRRSVLRQISVGQHHALALARGARSKHDGRQIFRLRAVGIAGLLPVQHFLKKERSLRHIRSGSLRVRGYPVLQLRAFLPRHRRHRLTRLVVDKHRRVRPVDQLTQLLRRQICIQRHRHAAAVHRTVIRNDPRIGIVAHDRDVRSLLTKPVNSRGKTLAVLPELCVSLRLHNRLFFAVALVALRLIADRILRSVSLGRLD